MSPDPSQALALEALARWWKTDRPVFIVGGLAGTGKSELMQWLEPTLGVAGTRWLAPTWKAAQVLTGRLGGPQATSVHNLIYRPLGVVHADDCGARSVGVCDHECKHLAWEFNPKERPALIVVDEASMLSEAMLNDLKQLGSRIVLVGDQGQLPPVRGNAILRPDALDAELTVNHRQQAGSQIIDLALLVRAGDKRWMNKGLAMGGEVSLTQDYRPDLALHASGDAVYVCWSNADVSRFNAETRKALGHGPGLVPGDRVMALENDPQAGVFNGQAGVMVGRDAVLMETGVVWDRGVLLVDGPSVDRAGGRRRDGTPLGFRHAYAVTCHKAQGSQYQRVVLRGSRPREDWQRWTYTALTRAKRELVIVY